MIAIKKRQKIFNTKKHLELIIPAGELLISTKNETFIGCEDGALEILEIQAEGRKRMKTIDFLRGFPLNIGTWQAIG